MMSKFIDKLVRELKEDHATAHKTHITSYPIFMVQRCTKEYGYDPQWTDDFDYQYIYDTEHLIEPSGVEEMEELAEYNFNNGTKFESLEDVKEGDVYVYEKIYYRTFWRNVQPFLTNDAAETFVKRREYQGKYRVYVESGSDNYEWIQLLKFLRNYETSSTEETNIPTI